MKGVVFRGERKLEILDFEDPVPGPGEAVIEMKASGMCGSDLHFYRNKPADVIRSLGFKDLASRGMSEDTPVIGGHEPCGQIVAVGAGVDPRAFKVGDRVAVFHYEGCLHCDHCRTGWTQMCSHGADIHGVIKHGGHAHYMKVPATSLVHLPDEVSFAAGAAISCGTGTAWGALLRLDISARDTLAVFGLGPVGLSAVQLAAAMGVEVIGVDIAADRVARAKEFGATHVIDGSKLDPIEEIQKLTGGLGVTCSMDCAGGEVPRQQAVRSTRPWGRIALVAVGGNLNVDGMKDVIGKQRTIIGSYTFSEVSMKQCIHFVADHGVDVDKLFTDYWKIDQADEAYRMFDAQSGGKGAFLF
ncbi:zinc-binding dehydrogenase [Burkholderia sp. Ac-20384]|uniref:Sorbitol dehydrogenase n=1 Tax=Burkholderia lata (strain ATCC 17760 / DSM 23089 / LMG 22485 / NCIMB 9086 / R18194 / 383) TaxID=482957 RepID=A0A833UG09_BURL3|nr:MULTISPECIES: zinc-binding dehydrogenase [Burkholderia]KAF1031911.1 MAG: Sorbitol dehydrogenase [Burkholderia lata]MBN3822166.1 zinc-binding dehydrogenase [Burkholderia sp. Ac-20384]